MKLYDDPLAPNPRRVRIYLAEKGIEIPKVSVSVVEGENFAPDFRAKNLFCKVPALELDDGTLLTESMTICRYLEELHPEPSLFGTETKERALIDMWQRHAEWDGLWPVAVAFRNRFRGFKDRAFAGVDESIPQVRELITPAQQLAGYGFDRFDQRLSDNAFLAGDAFSVADITALCAVDFGKLTGTDVLTPERPHLQRWHAEVSARPSAKA